MVALVPGSHITLRRRDREADLELAAVELSGHLEPCTVEDAEHRPVLRQHFGDEALDARLGSPQRKLLEQARADSPTLVLVRNGEGRLRGALVAQPHVLGDRDDAAVELADQDAALLPVRLEEVPDETVVDAADPVEAHVEAPFRKAGQERGEGARVFLCRRPQPEGRAVAENHVDRGGRPRTTRGYRQAPPPLRLVPRRPARLRARPSARRSRFSFRLALLSRARAALDIGKRTEKPCGFSATRNEGSRAGKAPHIFTPAGA